MAHCAWVMAAVFALAGVAHAEREPKEGPQDPRIRTVVYNPRDVVRIEVHYGYHTVIELGEDERIHTMTIGDSVAWEAVRNEAGNHIFLKPREESATTNMSVITNRRRYMFLLVGKEASSTSKMTFGVHFQYPEEDAARALEAQKAADREESLFVNASTSAIDPSKLNFRYRYAGSRAMVPSLLFDDGVATYLRFDAIADLPAIFVVETNGTEKKEGLANYRIEGPYVVVQRVAKQFALRKGDELTCIFNEAYPGAEKGDPVNGPRPDGVAEEGSSPRRPGQYVRRPRTTLAPTVSERNAP